jgi:hypothetical protein
MALRPFGPLRQYIDFPDFPEIWTERISSLQLATFEYSEWADAETRFDDFYDDDSLDFLIELPSVKHIHVKGKVYKVSVKEWLQAGRERFCQLVRKLESDITVTFEDECIFVRPQ